MVARVVWDDLVWVRIPAARQFMSDLRIGGVIIFAYLVLLLPFIDSQPWRSHEQADTPRYLTTAQQHLQRGLSETWGRDYFPDGETRYLNHPGMLGLTLAPLVLVFGAHNATIHSFAALVSAGTLALLMWTARKNGFNWRNIIYIAVSMPVFILHGKNIVGYIPVLFLGLMAILLFKLWRTKLSALAFNLLLFTTLFLAASFDWPGFLFGPAIFFWELLGKRNKSVLLTTALAGTAALGLFLVQNKGITGTFLGPLLETSAQREYYTNFINSTRHQNLSLVSWLTQQGQIIARLVSVAGVLAALWGGWLNLNKIWRNQKINFAEQIAWAFFFVGAFYNLFTAPMSYLHSYQAILFTPTFFFLGLLGISHPPKNFKKFVPVIFFLLGIIPSAYIITNFYLSYLP